MYSKCALIAVIVALSGQVAFASYDKATKATIDAVAQATSSATVNKIVKRGASGEAAFGKVTASTSEIGSSIGSNPGGSVLHVQGTNQQILIQRADTNGQKWYLDVDNAAGGTFQINSPSSGETGLISPSNTIYWGAGGTPLTRLSATSNSSDTNPAGFGNTRATLSARNTDSTAGNYGGIFFANANNFTAGIAAVCEDHTNGAESSHFSFVVKNAGTAAEAFRINKDKSLQALAYGAGVLKSDSSGNISSGVPTVAQSTIATQSIGAADIDWSAGNTFKKTLAANTTFTFSNLTSGQSIVVALTNTASNYTVTWPGTVKWSGGAAPTQTVGAKTDVYTFVYDGANTYGSVIQNF